ncbi:MAG: GIY-YIG nuclease family protein [Cyanobacteria bacterium P01_H01_bin.21]
MRSKYHPSRWSSVSLADRNNLPETSGVYAVIQGRKIYYIGFSTNLNQRWRGKSHHRFAQADALGRPRLHYLPLSKHDARTAEKLLITRHSPPWNYTKVPVVRKLNWVRRSLMAAVGLLVLLIASRNLMLGILAAVVAIALFRS